ncbi:MAG TPA: HAMP domain-containing sensor histidine kinase [Polyangiaceae bacterium]|nr:HAMP domain-containing sensor histidine kinase [Polyangiaceae bacterium]
MTIPAQRDRVEELTVGKGARLEELVDRESLSQLAKSFAELSGVGMRVFDSDGKLLADASLPVELVTYLTTLKVAKTAVESTVSSVKNLDPGPTGQASIDGVSGGRYRVLALEHDGRRVGRLVLGPYFPPSLKDIPAALIELEPALDLDRARGLLTMAPRVTDESMDRLAQHARAALDVVMFSGLKALLTGSMHLASVRESYRELQSKQDKLQVAYDRLKELDRLKSNFLATVSHELRTPLTSIIGYSEMLLEGIAGEVVGEQREFVTTIREKGEQLLTLIKGLLDLSKLESGTMSLRRGTLDVAPLVKDVAQTMAPHAKKKGIVLQADVEAGLPALWADGERLRQVLLNLIENAIKFTPTAGSVRISAKLASMAAASGADEGGLVLLGAQRTAVEFRVADNGIGIPESERGRVFDAFYQVDSSSTREQGGTGLGLSIVKRLVEGHDGAVRVEANEPQGTVFVVAIPLKRSTLRP